MPPVSWRAAFSVHVLTASGAAFALLALMAAVERAWPTMFLWLGAALLVDAVDGPLARRLGVAKLLPRWSGETLDLVVDFVTYVFVPAFAIARSGLLPQALAVPLALAIVVSAALYFADRDMKTSDNYFRGFPGLWNAAAFYLILLRLPPWAGAAAVAALVVLTFVPVPFVHPLRVTRWRVLTLAVMAAGAALALVTLARGMDPGPFVTAALCAVAVYTVGVGLLRTRP